MFIAISLSTETASCEYTELSLIHSIHISNPCYFPVNQAVI